MAQTLYPPAGPQSVGRVLDSGFRIFKISLVSCLLYGALAMIAGQLPNIYFIATGKPLVSFGNGDPVWIALYLVGMLTSFIFWGAVLLRQHGFATGQRMGSGAALRQSARKLPANLGVCLLFVAAAVLTLVVIRVVQRMLGIDLVPQNYLSIGAIGLIVAIPLIYVSTPFVMACVALLVDDLGPLGSVRYALRLIRGNWWRTTAVITIAVIILIVYYGVILMVVGMMAPLLGATDFSTVSALVAVSYVVLGSLGMPFTTAAWLAILGDLKVRREGIDLERRVAGIASV
jgi:hypothetical protein